MAKKLAALRSPEMKGVLRTAASIAHEKAGEEVAAFAKAVGHKDKIKPALMVTSKRKK